MRALSVTELEQRTANDPFWLIIFIWLGLLFLFLLWMFWHACVLCAPNIHWMRRAGVDKSHSWAFRKTHRWLYNSINFQFQGNSVSHSTSNKRHKRLMFKFKCGRTHLHVRFNTVHGSAQTWSSTPCARFHCLFFTHSEKWPQTIKIHRLWLFN